jgi:hypothetical protein
MPLVSLGPGGAYVAVLPDGIFASAIEPVLRPRRRRSIHADPAVRRRRAATPGMVPITSTVDPDVRPGDHYSALIHGFLLGRSVGVAPLTIRVVPSGPSVPPAEAVAISAGDGYSLAALADGSARGWGSNRNGQRGTSTKRLSRPCRSTAASHRS